MIKDSKNALKRHVLHRGRETSQGFVPWMSLKVYVCVCPGVHQSKSKSYVSPVCMWCPRLASSLYDLHSSIWNRILSEHRTTGIRLPLVALVHTISPSLRMANICKHVVILSFSSKVWYCETWASHRVRSHGWCWQGSTFSRALCWSGRCNVGETWDATFHEGFWFRKKLRNWLCGICEGTCSAKRWSCKKSIVVKPCCECSPTGRCFQDQAECPDDWLWGSGCSSRVVCFSMCSKRKDCKYL